MAHPAAKTTTAGRVAGYIPLLGVLRHYQPGWLRSDVAAGATVFAVLVPSALAYGSLAGLDPIVGLYAAMGAMVGYAIFGSSRHAILGPDATLPS